MGNLLSSYRVGNFTFRLNRELNTYSARGSEVLDDYGDKWPEPAVIDAAEKLTNMLAERGYEVDWSTSEKGWVDVWVKGKKD